MQWAKSKTYIIMAFIVVNLILLIGIVNDKSHYDFDFTNKNLSNLKTLLDSKNISYDISLNTATDSIHPISILYAKPDDELYKKIYDKYAGDINVIDDVYVDININRHMSSKEELFDFAQEFVQDNFDEGGYILKESIQEGENFLVTYEEQYNGVFIEQGYIKFIYTPEDNINVSILKIKRIDEIDVAMNMMSNSQALSRMLPQLKNGDKIVSMDKCYNFIGDGNVSNMDKLEEIRLLPFYRAKLQNGNFIYVGAANNR